MINALTSVLFVTVLAVVARYARLREPQWLSKDRTRFITRARVLDPRGGRPSRWMSVRGGIGTTSVVLQPGFTAQRTIAGHYGVVSRLADDHHGHVLFSLRGDSMVVLRVQKRSELVGILDAMIPHAN
jgi:hypothetical protein